MHPATITILLCAIAGEPAEDFAGAEELVRSRHWAEARAAYEAIARRHAGTPEAAIAAGRAKPSAFLGAGDLLRTGPSANRVDIVVLGEGYQLEHLRSFAELAEDVPGWFARQEPFREYFSYFNFVRGDCVSADAGVDGFGRDYDTVLGGFTRATDAGHVGVDGKLVRAVLAEIDGSDDLAIVFVKLGVAGTGGAGIATIGGLDERTAIHEWGHAFARLGDEYDTRTHERGAVSRSVNVSASEEPAEVPWRHWLDARHPSIGVYEGAAGQVRDAWRPTASGCVMRDGEFFCPVCTEAIVLRIHELVDPIEEAHPAPPPPPIREPVVLERGRSAEFSVRTMKPASHEIEVRWWVQDVSSLPETGTDALDRVRARDGGAGSGQSGDRSAATSGGRTATPSSDRRERTKASRSERGPLKPLADRPTRTSIGNAEGVHVLRLAREDLEPGRYRITCRARDTTRLRDERFPLVLKDERGLLESERVWWLLVR